MANMEMIILMAMVGVCALFGMTDAQTTHQVGDALGWVVPPGGDAAYITWTSTKTFRAGDILVFKFTRGFHSVAEVSKESFGTCNSASPISISTTSPTRITLSSAGEHFFLCTFSGHCGLGQKLAINVSASSSSPAPQPSPATPSPVPVPEPTPSPEAPAPTPSVVEAPAPAPGPASGSSRVYTVGDAAGWAVPRTGNSPYQTWTSGKSFKVGDVLVFNFANGAHNVAEVTKASFDSCDIASPLSTSTTSPTRITLTTLGEHHYICTFPSHCSLGQKLAINVTAGGSATPPSSNATPPSNALTPPGETNPESPISPPGNSAPSSVAALALPITLLCIALAYLY
ncbi:hypothetical protein Leryth_025687 [Lithospermum erythrorhizon]|nr:hypothetical protein Leryth_025687 [Lithospermum erythrorhizon]